MTNSGRVQLFNLGRRLRSLYGRTAFIEKNHFIVSNVARCIKSFKFFLLGVLSDSDSVRILSNFEDAQEIVESPENQRILYHLDEIIGRFKLKKKELKASGKVAASVTFTCGDPEIAAHCEAIGLDTKSFSMEFPKKKANRIFHPIKKFKWVSGPVNRKTQDAPRKNEARGSPEKGENREAVCRSPEVENRQFQKPFFVVAIGR